MAINGANIKKIHGLPLSMEYPALNPAINMSAYGAFSGFINSIKIDI